MQWGRRRCCRCRSARWQLHKMGFGGLGPASQRLWARSAMRLALCRASWLPAKNAPHLWRRSMGLGGRTRSAAGRADPGSDPEPSPQQTAAPPPPPVEQQREQQQQQPFRILSEEILHRRYLTLYNRTVQFPAEDGGAEVRWPAAPASGQLARRLVIPCALAIACGCSTCLP